MGKRKRYSLISSRFNAIKLPTVTGSKPCWDPRAGWRPNQSPRPAEVTLTAAGAPAARLAAVHKVVGSPTQHVRLSCVHPEARSERCFRIATNVKGVNAL